MIKRHPIVTMILVFALGAGAVYTWMNRAVPDFGRAVLVFSQSEGASHDSIPAGIAAIESLVRAEKFNVVLSEDPSVFSDASLAKYRAVVFLNTSGDVLNAEEQIAFERFIQAGGGYVGIHAAADSKFRNGREWSWYQRLVGGIIDAEPNNTEELVTIKLTDADSELGRGAAEQWQISDELLNYRRISKGINVLMTATRHSGAAEKVGADARAVAWYRDFDGGRSFYLGLGHTAASYEDANFIALLRGGIEYAMGDGSALDYSRSRPEAWRFTRTVLDSNLNEPLKIAFSPSGDLYFVERGGNFLRYDFEQGKSIVVHHFDVRTFAEYGLLGFAFDPDFENNHWLYVYRTIAAGNAGRHVLARFKFENGVIDEESEQVFLSATADGNDSQATAHTGGDMLFDDVGNLWLTTGDDTLAGGAANIDDRPGHIGSDAGRSAGNTQDLRGKILRIKPRAEPDENGRYYDIPKGNLFSSADEGRPEIYVMGLRNPYTIAYDHRRQRVYWGEVGPDSSEYNDRGPWGFDEVNYAEKAGNFGWPYVIADNQPYSYFDYDAEKSLEKADVNAPVNTSKNNTGLKVLPPAQPAWIYYPYSESDEFFELGSGGRNALVVPIYYSDEVDATSEVKFPAYFDGKLLISDFIRRWLMVVNTDSQGQPESMVPVFEQSFSAPLDMVYGPDGALYVVEYGTDWFSQNPDSYISRIEYYSGDNAPPVAVAKASKTIGAAPLSTELDASASFDRGAIDGKLSYRWQLIENGKPGKLIGEKQIQAYTFETHGEQFVQLTVTDDGGQESSQRLRFLVGNERPEVEIKLTGNRSFYWEDQPVEYQVIVNDLEDGSTTTGELSGADIVVKSGYVAGGEDLAAALTKQSVNPVLAGSELVKSGSDCHACHSLDAASIGPSFMDIAARYKNRSDAANYLQNAVAKGSSGQWGGNHAMPGHPSLSADQLNYISSFILSLGAGEQAAETSALTGQIRFDQHQSDYYEVSESGLLTIDLGRFYPGAYLLNASYTDKGTNLAPALQSQKTIILRYPRISAGSFDELVNMRGFGVGSEKVGFVTEPSKGATTSYGLLKNIDLSGIKTIKVTTWAQKPVMPGGPIELRLDSPEGRLIASAEVESSLIADAKGKAVELDVSNVEGIHDLYLGASLAPGDAEAPEVHRALYGILTVEFLR
ncbi:ThuA domain-containing protein [Zhongshania sp.]|uniref:ThuA domain-containing protein n=1 Tax=Zhongshania sp. TaxID=1971902 RepID=UPI00356AE0CF